MMKISDLQSKDIVNMENGRRLGHLTDLDINLSTGKIEAMVINGTNKVMGLLGKADAEVIIPWDNIIKIGSDVIIVEVPESIKAFSDTSFRNSQVKRR
ncbi:YlmC/YmxH family sporulation protein [Alkalihalobacillus alcalophilus ATCC 27647 = CGMCC 1.3604]|uniref:Sporulation protein n=1 Tax=Alkalihalobacillus alcalophilus ATCC 27647 = CGMCC 1.3604 TaxID=1218173 RepID=A0A094XG90_ALKAL|nr:YlmC/YmxH family sporulation protein [Alkalihalobacillus alcalophilus]KGA97770.1 sporulation protein [Alkalihalobacillus alcalophilus ATCC 27647 = CGMCC 1.3604]MED1563121.1 YlmC/YmxH family sporulation protein [Alkalihalobacillus alcalophilus]THG89257.1 YlmC/YmxH family sporulation protein [Alkalihalobacillus alcalophilus ATCC 27647 = CGMCC 1.3604]